MTGGRRVLALLTDAWGAGGGIAQFNRDWVAAACAAGAEVEVLALGTADPPDAGLAGPVRVIGAKLGRAAFVARACRASAMAPRPSAVFCGHLHLAPVAALVARRAGCPWWLQLHGIEAWQRPGAIRRAAAERADLLVSVSRFTRRSAHGWWAGDPRRSRVLPNTVDPAFTPGPRDASLALRLCIDGGPVLLTVGRLAAREAYKGHDRIIRALPQLASRWPAVRYVVAGDGDDRSRLEALAAAVGVREQLRFIGTVSREDLPAVYRLADAFAMPSTGEGFGIAFLEAMASGVPALGLDCDGSVDALGDGALGAAVPAAGLVDGLVQLLSGQLPAGPALAAAVQGRFGPARFRTAVKRLLGELGPSWAQAETT